MNVSKYSRSTQAYILPAGTYFIGDPCYMFSHDTPSWSEICKQSFNHENESLGGKLIPFNGRLIFTGNTAYGDGNYEGSDGYAYGVDAGILGATPIELNEDKYADLTALGTIVTFDEPFECSWSDGVVTLGHIIIDTNYHEDEDFGDSYFDED